MASTIGPLITTGFGLVITGFGLHLLRQGYDHRRRAGLIDETETTNIRNLCPGLVELKGTATPVDGGDLHRAPISNVDAIISRVEVHKKPGNQWMTVHEALRRAPFTLDDGTGEVRVEPTDDARLNLEQREIEVAPREEAPPDVKRFAQQSGLIEEENSSMIESGTRLNAKWRYRESVLDPGEDVYVLGEALETDAGWGDTQFVLRSDGSELVISDRSERKLIEDERESGLTHIIFGLLVIIFGLLFLILPLLGFGTWNI